MLPLKKITALAVILVGTVGVNALMVKCTSDASAAYRECIANQE